MGVDFHACILYGIEVELPKDREWDYIDDFNERNNLLEIMNVSPMDGSRYILFVKDTYISCGEYDPSIVYKMSYTEGSVSEPFWDSRIYDACMQHDLEYIYPAWYFITYFS